MLDIIDIDNIEHVSLRGAGARITAIVLHDTGGKTAHGTINWFLNPDSKVSSHYVIDKDGKVYRTVPDAEKAWHAGRSTLHGQENVNDFSIGIEIVDNDDKDKYPEEQLDALFQLVTELCHEYHIPLNRVVGHADICVPPGRKVDPGPDFPWYEFLITVGTLLAQKQLES